MSLLRLWSRHPRHLGYGLLHFFSSAVGQTFFVSLFVADVTADMAWADDTFASLYSGVTLAAALALPYVGTLVDRHPARYVSTAAALAIAGALVGLAAANTIWAFAPALLLARLGGQGVLPLIGSTTIGRYFTAQRGRALSATAIGTSLAEVSVPALAVWAIGTYGYHVAWLTAAGYMALAFVPLVWWLLPRGDAFQTAGGAAARASADTDAPSVADLPVDGLPPSRPPRSYTRAEVLSDVRFRLVVPALVLSPFVLTGLIFNQGLIAELRGYTAAWMALGISSYGVARGAMTLLGGGLIDRYGAERLIQLVAAPMLLGLTVFLLAEGRWTVPAFFVLAGLATGAESVVWPALWAERYGPRHLGSIKSATRLLMVLTTAAAPVLFTWVLGYGLPVLLASLLAYATVAVGLVWVAASGSGKVGK